MNETVLEEEGLQLRHFYDDGNENGAEKAEGIAEEQEEQQLLSDTQQENEADDGEGDRFTVAEGDDEEVMSVDESLEDNEDQLTETEDECSNRFPDDREQEVALRAQLKLNSGAAGAREGNARQGHQDSAAKNRTDNGDDDHGGTTSSDEAGDNDGGALAVPITAPVGGNPNEDHTQYTGPTQTDRPDRFARAGAQDESWIGTPSLNLQLPSSTAASDGDTRSGRRNSRGGGGDRSRSSVEGYVSDGKGAIAESAQAEALSQLHLASNSSSEHRAPDQNDVRSRAPSPPRRTGQGSGVFLQRTSTLMTSTAATAASDDTRGDLVRSSGAVRSPARKTDVAQAEDSGDDVPLTLSPAVSSMPPADVDVSITNPAEHHVNTMKTVKDTKLAAGAASTTDNSSQGFLSCDGAERKQGDHGLAGRIMSSSPPEPVAAGWFDAQIAEAAATANGSVLPAAGEQTPKSRAASQRRKEMDNGDMAPRSLKSRRANTNTATCSSLPVEKAAIVAARRTSPGEDGWIRRARPAGSGGSVIRGPGRGGAEDNEDVNTQEFSLQSQNILALGVPADRRALPAPPPSAMKSGSKRKIGEREVNRSVGQEQQTSTTESRDEQRASEGEEGTLSLPSSLTNTQDVLANGELSQMEKMHSQTKREADRSIMRMVEGALKQQTRPVNDVEASNYRSDEELHCVSQHDTAAEQTPNIKRALTTGLAGGKGNGSLAKDSDGHDHVRPTNDRNVSGDRRPRSTAAKVVAACGPDVTMKGKQMKSSADILAKQSGRTGVTPGGVGVARGKGAAHTTPGAYIGGLGAGKSGRKRPLTSSPLEDVPRSQEKDVFAFDMAEDDDDGRVVKSKRRRSTELDGCQEGENSPRKSPRKHKTAAACLNKSNIRHNDTITNMHDAVSSPGRRVAPTAHVSAGVDVGPDRSVALSVDDNRRVSPHQAPGASRPDGCSAAAARASDQRDDPNENEMVADCGDPDVLDMGEDGEEETEEIGDGDDEAGCGMGSVADRDGIAAAAAAEANARAMMEMQRFELTSGSGTGRDDNEDDDEEEEEEEDDNDRKDRDDSHDRDDHGEGASPDHPVGVGVAPGSSSGSMRAKTSGPGRDDDAVQHKPPAASASARSPASAAAEVVVGSTRKVRHPRTSEPHDSPTIGRTPHPRRARTSATGTTDHTRVATSPAGVRSADEGAQSEIKWAPLWAFLQGEGWEWRKGKRPLDTFLYLRPGQSSDPPYGDDGPFTTERAACDYVRHRNPELLSQYNEHQRTASGDQLPDGRENGDGGGEGADSAIARNVVVGSDKAANAVRERNAAKQPADGGSTEKSKGKSRGIGSGRKTPVESVQGRQISGTASRRSRESDGKTNQAAEREGNKTSVTTKDTPDRNFARVVRAKGKKSHPLAGASIRRGGGGTSEGATGVGSERPRRTCDERRELTACTERVIDRNREGMLEEWSLARHRVRRVTSQNISPGGAPLHRDPGPSDDRERDPAAPVWKRGRRPKKRHEQPVGIGPPLESGEDGRQYQGWMSNETRQPADSHDDRGTPDLEENQDCQPTQEQRELRSALNLMDIEVEKGNMASDDSISASRGRNDAGAVDMQDVAVPRSDGGRFVTFGGDMTAMARGDCPPPPASTNPPQNSPRLSEGSNATPRRHAEERQATSAIAVSKTAVPPSLSDTASRGRCDSGSSTSARRGETPMRLYEPRARLPPGTGRTNGRGRVSTDDDGFSGGDLARSPPAAAAGDSIGTRNSARRPLADVGVILTGLTKEYRKTMQLLISKKGGKLVTFPSRPGGAGGNYKDWISGGESRVQVENARRVIAVAKPGSYRAPKYLFAVAAGVDIVHPVYIEQCTISLATTNYLLPVGRSAVLDRELVFYPRGHRAFSDRKDGGGRGEPCSNESSCADTDRFASPARGSPFQGKSVLLHIDKRGPHKSPGFELTLWAAGARVVTIGADGLGGVLKSSGDINGDVTTVLNLLKRGDFEYFVSLSECRYESRGGVGAQGMAGQDDAAMREQLVDAARGAGVQAGTLEWAAQCIVHRRMLRYDETTCPWFNLEFGKHSDGSGTQSSGIASGIGSRGRGRKGKGRAADERFFSYLTPDSDSGDGGRYVSGDYAFRATAQGGRCVVRVEWFRRAAAGHVEVLVSTTRVSPEGKELSLSERNGEVLQELVDPSTLSSRVIVVDPDENYPCVYAFVDPNVFVKKRLEETEA